jgi:amino acid transporter
VWLWIISLLLFFWPQGNRCHRTCASLSRRGRGVSLGERSLSAISTDFSPDGATGPTTCSTCRRSCCISSACPCTCSAQGIKGLADNKAFASIASLTLLAALTLFNILGLGVGKWINNLGAIGTFIAAAVLIGLGIVIWSRFGTAITAADFQDSCESEVRAQFLRSDLLWPCWPRARFGDG